MRVGIVGFGTRGQMFAQILKHRPADQLVAVFDADAARVEAAARAEGLRPTVDYPEFFALNPEVVIVTTPDFAHREPVVRSAEAGCHVFVEKPFAMSLADCDAMIAAVERAGVACLPAFENRWNLPFVKAKGVVERGELGEITLVGARLNGMLDVPTRELRWVAQTSVAWFLMSHTVDLALWYTGRRAVRVFASAVEHTLARRGIRACDAVEAIVEYEGGCVGSFESCWTLPDALANTDDFEVRLVGDRATVTINTFRQMIMFTGRQYTYPEILRLENVHGQMAGFPVFMLYSFLDDLASGRGPRVTLQEARETTRVLEGIHRSLAARGPVELP